MALRQLQSPALALAGAALAVTTAYFLWSSLAAPRDLEEMIALGQERLEGGDFPGAGEWFNKAVSYAPDRLEPRLARARLFEVQGKISLAVGEYRQALQAQPDVLETALSLARLLARDAQEPAAQEVLHQAARRHPQAAEPWRELAALHLAQGDPAAARQAYQALEERRPHEPEAALALGALAELGEDGPAAEAAYRRALSLDGDSIPAWEGLGRVAAAAQQFAQAEEAYRQVVARVDDPSALTVRATLVERQARYHEACRLFRRALEQLREASGDQRETRALAWTGLGTSLLALGQRDEAYAALASALTDDPDQPEALWALVPIYLDQGQFEPARRALRALVQRNEDPWYWTLLGRAEAGQGHWLQAHGAFERALELDSEHLPASKWLGITQRVLGQYEAAAARLGRVVQRLPDDGLAHLNLAIALGQMNRGGSARRAFARARELMPQGAEPLYYEAHYLLNRGQVGAAYTLAQQALERAPDDPGALEVMARVAAQRGDVARAQELVGRALAQARNDGQRAYLRGVAQRWPAPARGGARPSSGADLEGSERPDPPPP